MSFCTIILFAILCAPGDEDVWYPNPRHQPNYKAPVVRPDNALSHADAVFILNSSEDPFDLEYAALSLCIHNNDESLFALRRVLLNESFHERLGSEQHTLSRMSRVLRGIALSPNESARTVLLELAKDREFVRHRGRRELIQAMGFVPHPSGELIEYLQFLVQSKAWPRDALLALMRLDDHRSAPFVERIVAQDRYGLRDSALLYMWWNRNKTNVVNIVANLIRNRAMRGDALSLLIRGQFAKDRVEYDGLRISGRSEPSTPRSEASSEVLEQVLRIAEDVLKMKLDEELLNMVRRERTEIIEILESRGMETDVGAKNIAVTKEEYTTTIYTGIAIIVMAALAGAGAWRCRRARKLTQRRRDKRFGRDDSGRSP